MGVCVFLGVCVCRCVFVATHELSNIANMEGNKLVPRMHMGVCSCSEGVIR